MGFKQRLIIITLYTTPNDPLPITFSALYVWFELYSNIHMHIINLEFPKKIRVRLRIEKRKLCSD